MITIRFDKKLNLLFGLLYGVYKDNHCNYNWIKSTYPEFDEAFYLLYKKGITKEFENYIMSGGLDFYDRTVHIAFSLNDNYEIIMNSEIENISNSNKNFHSTQLSLFLKEFVRKTNYEEFFSSFRTKQNLLIAKFRDVLNSFGEFNSTILEDFFGYSKGDMEVVLLNFSNGSYGISSNGHITYVSCLMNNGEFNKHILSTLFHEFSHPYVNPLCKKYFNNNDLELLFTHAKENGLENCYTNIVTLINEYLVRAIQVILGKNFFEKEYISLQIKRFKKIGYPYIEDLIQVFSLKNKYPSFDDFYEKEIVTFFHNLNEKIRLEKINPRS